MTGTSFRYDARYYDIVQDRRIVYAYEMYADDQRISVSVTTIEFTEHGDGTTLAFTEQGAYLEGFDGDEAPSLRRQEGRGDARRPDPLPDTANRTLTSDSRLAPSS